MTVSCPLCKGTGRVVVREWHQPPHQPIKQTETCGKCNGKGSFRTMKIRVGRKGETT